MSVRINYEEELRKADAKLARLQAEKLVNDVIREHEERERFKRPCSPRETLAVSEMVKVEDIRRIR